MDEKTKFQQGDKVVLKNNSSTVYIVSTVQEDGYLICYSPQGKEEKFPSFLLEKYDAVRAFGF